jgi:hypothetical protein
MTMHLCGPALSLNGRKKGRQKFRNADEARRARELAADWQELQNKWNVDAEDKRRRRAMKAEPLSYQLTTPVGRTNTAHIPSRDTGHSGAVASKPVPQYTGTAMIGVGVMHKSNSVPIFSDQEAVEISRMRRG